MSESVTKQDLNNLREGTKQDLHTLREGLEATITANTKEIIGHFNKSQGYQNERMDQIDDQLAEINVKLDAITKMLVMRQEMHNLIRELGKKGIALDESQIFVS